MDSKAVYYDPNFLTIRRPQYHKTTPNPGKHARVPYHPLIAYFS